MATILTPSKTTNSQSSSSSSSSTSASKPTITFKYKVRAGGKWYPEVCNLADYAGVRGKAITDVAIGVTQGSVKYRVHVKGGSWLPYVTGYNTSDGNNGYAGMVEKLMQSKYITIHRLLMQISMDIRKLNTELP